MRDARRDIPAWSADRLSQTRGFTLLETLVVIVLVSLVMLMLAGSLARGDANARVTSTAKAVLDLDRRARILAPTGGAVTITSDRDGSTLVLSRVRSGEQIAAVPIPGGIGVSFLEPKGERALGQVRFGADSHSPDYLLVVWSGGGDGASQPVPRRAYRVAGLTGYVMAEGDR